MNDTPRTDAMEKALYEGPWDAWKIDQARIGLCKELERENARLRESMQEAWKLVNAMAGQEYWDRAE